MLPQGTKAVLNTLLSATALQVITIFYLLNTIISAVSKSCFHNIRDLRRIHNNIDKTNVVLLPLLFTLKLI